MRIAIFASRKFGDKYAIKETSKRSPHAWLIAFLRCCLLLPIAAHAQNQGSVFVSADAGANWTSALTNPAKFNCVLVDQANVMIVYACSDAPNGIFQSVDGGTTWSIIFSTEGVTTMTISPSNDMILLAGTTSGIYTSVDQGRTWGPLVGLGNQVTAIAFDPVTAPNTIYAGTLTSGVFVSRDAGATWTKTGLSQFSGSTHALAVDPNNSGTFYAGTDSGVWVTTDYGQTWSATGLGSPQTANSILLDPNTAGTMYAATSAFFSQGRVFVSINKGATWSEHIVEPNTRPVTSLAITSDSQMLFAGVGGQGVYLSQDGGMTWSESDNGITQFNISSLALAPGNPWTIFMSTLRGCTTKC